LHGRLQPDKKGRPFAVRKALVHRIARCIVTRPRQRCNRAFDATCDSRYIAGRQEVLRHLPA